MVLVLAAEILCVYAALSGLLRLLSGRAWLPRRRRDLGPSAVRRSGIYQLGLGIGLGVEVAMIWVAQNSWLPANMVYGLAAGGLLLALIAGLIRAIFPGERHTSVAQDLDAG